MIDNITLTKMLSEFPILSFHQCLRGQWKPRKYCRYLNLDCLADLFLRYLYGLYSHSNYTDNITCMQHLPIGLRFDKWESLRNIQQELENDQIANTINIPPTSGGREAGAGMKPHLYCM